MTPGSALTVPVSTRLADCRKAGRRDAVRARFQLCDTPLGSLSMEAGLLHGENVATMFVDHLKGPAAASRHAGQGVFGHEDRQTRLFGEQTVEIT